MTDVSQTLKDIFQNHFQHMDLDFVDLAPILSQKDKMLRMRTLQEMFEDLDHADILGSPSSSLGYLVQLRPKQPSSTLPQNSQSEEPLSTESLYLTDGKFNNEFLLKNAKVLFDAGEYTLAQNIYKTILSTGESLGIALYYLGRCLEAVGKVEAAIKHYEESIAYQPSLDTFRHLANLFIKQNNNQRAAELFERAVLLKGLSLEVKFELLKACGNCWTRVNNSEAAQKSFKLSLEIRPTADEVRSNLATLYLQNNQLDEAKRNFRDAIASNPKNALALAGIGTCYLAENNKKMAHDYLSQSLEIDVNNPTALFQLVKCAYEIKSYSTASKLLKEYIQIAPISANLLFSLGGLQFHLGRMNEAELTLNKVLEIQPQHTAARELLQRMSKYNKG